MDEARDPLVGRQEELALLRRWLADARRGAGRVVVVNGPAGIGKTRLVRELVAGAGGTPVGWGAAVDDAGMPPLWPWTRALRDRPGPGAAVAALVAGGRGHGSAADTAAAAFGADTEVLDAIGADARDGAGLLLVLDDVQWADQASTRLLGRVAGEAGRLPLLVVVGHRDTTALPAPVLAGATDIVTLGPLSEADAVGLLSAAVAHADPAAVRRAASRSGGSPLYLRTLTRVAAAQLRGTAAWDAAVGEAPELRQLVAAATRSAGPDAQAVVEALSVLGVEADPEILAELLDAGSAGAALERALPAVPAGLLEPPSPQDGRVRFAHALVRDAVYATLAPTRRDALHRRAAELLEPRAGARDDRAGAIARHWHRAGAPDRVLTWAVRAADAARVAGAYDESASYLRLALDALDRGHQPDADRAELLLDLARAEYLAGHLPESLATAERAANEGAGRWDVAARAAVVVQGIGDLATNRRVERLCRSALSRPADDAASGLRSRVEAQLACVLLELDEVDEAVDWSTRALAHATDSGDPDAELDAVRAHATVTWDPGLHDELTELGRRAIELAGPTGRPLAELWGRIWRSDTAMQRGDVPAAQREVAAMAALADRSGLPLVRWHVLRRQASMAALAGRFGECREQSAKAAALAAGWDDDSVRGTHLGQTVCLGLLRGDPAEVTPGWRDMLAAIGAQPPIAHAVLASALYLEGDLDQAEAIYRPLVAGVAGLTRGIGRPVIAYLSDLAPAFGDAAGCRAVREVLSAAYGDSPATGAGTVFYYGSTARMCAALDLGAGDAARAVEGFEAGLRVDERLGALPFVAKGRLGLARALAATGDAARAVPHARAAAADARRLDMPGLLRAADAFLTAEAARARAADPLTAREREIVELVAQALSNREVAARLVLSERTVESHVRRILAKLDLTSRTDITRWYLRGGSAH